MVKGKQRILSLLTAMIMLISMLSGFPVRAEELQEGEAPRYGLVIGYTEWNPDLEKRTVDPERMETDIWVDAKREEEVVLGWYDENGALILFDSTDIGDISFTDKGGDVVTPDIQPLMEERVNETTHEIEWVSAGEGMFKIVFPASGEYKMIYSGSLLEGNFPQGAVVNDTVDIYVEMPLVSIYSEGEPKEEYLLGNQVNYGPSGEFYLNAAVRTRENFKIEATIAEINFFDEAARQAVTVDEIKKGEVYKLTVSDEYQDRFDLQVVMDIVESNSVSEQWIVLDERREDRWFTCFPPERFGLLFDWTQMDEDTPIFQTDRMTSCIDGLEAKGHNLFTFGWKGSDGTVTPILPGNIDKLTAYDGNGDKVEYEWIHNAVRWDPEEMKDVEMGNGTFDIRFNAPGTYYIEYAYDAAPTIPEDAVFSNRVILRAKMPAVSAYDSAEISMESLVGPHVEYTAEKKEFYIYKLDEILDTRERRYTLTGYRLEGPPDIEDAVSVEAVAGSYTVTIPEGYKDHFNLVVDVKVQEFRKEDSQWIEDGGWEYEYRVDFDYWEPELFGLSVSWPEWDQQELPIFPEELWHEHNMDAKVPNTVAIGWKDAEGVVEPIPQSQIDKLHLFDPEGNEVTDPWISVPMRWDPEQERDAEIAMDGLFQVTVPGTGQYFISIDKDVSQIEEPEGMKVAAFVTLNVDYPAVGIYNSLNVSDDTLLGRTMEFRDEDAKEYYIITSDRVFPYNSTERSIKSYRVEPPSGFEDEVDQIVTISEVSDHVLKVVIAEDCEVGFDVIVEIEEKEQYLDFESGTWKDGEIRKWEDRLCFWYQMKEYYGFIAGFPAIPGPMGNMQQYLDGFFATYGNSLVFGWRDSTGEEEQIREDDLAENLMLLDEEGNEAEFFLEKQENDDYIYDVTFNKPGLYYLKYTGPMAVDEQSEDKEFLNAVKIWVDLPFVGAYTGEEAVMDTYVGSPVVYEPDQLEFYINGISIGDLRGTMEVTINDVQVTGTEESDVAEIESTDSGAKVVIKKLPGGDYDGEFSLNVDFTVDSKWFNEQGELEGEASDTMSVLLPFVPGEGFDRGSIKVNLKAEGAALKSAKICLANLDDESYYGIDGSVIEDVAKIWITIKPGTPVVFENLPVGSYLVGEDSDSAAVTGYQLSVNDSILESGELLVEADETTTFTLKNVYTLKKYKYKNEWRNGVWYNKDNTQTYKYKGAWKHNSKGYWYEDTSGWYAKKQWLKIDGKQYYFAANGYMASDEYIDGYYVAKSGAYDNKGKAVWKHNAKGWWYELKDGSSLKNCWAKIDGKWYYFKSNGYAAANEWVKGYYWIGKNCVWTYKPQGSWHKDSKGYRFGDTSGWYAKSETIVIDGKSYTFDARGYQK